jgi:putative ABC transport system ATP-binding protein
VPRSERLEPDQLGADPTVWADDVTISFASVSGRVDALTSVSASFAPGAVHALVGPTGSGKSSFLRVLAGHDRPTSGTVVVAGHVISRMSTRGRRRVRRRHIGFVFQRPAANLFTYLDVDEHLRVAARLRGAYDPAEAGELLDALGLGDRRDHRPAQLSGGEQQRLAFAMAAIGGPPVLLADEPTAELDHEAGARLLDAVGRLAARGTCVVFATHDPQAQERSDHVVALDHGRSRPEVPLR